MTMIMDVIKEENNHTNEDTSSYTTTNNINSIPLTSMSSVIHANQQSVIQTASPTIQTSVLPPKNVLLVGGKLTSVIQTPTGNTIQSLQMTNSKSDMDDSLSADEESIKKRREKLIRRPSYRKILNDIARAELGCAKMESSGSDCDSNIDNEVSTNTVPVSAHYQTVVPSAHLQLSSHCGNVQTLPTMMSNSLSATGPLVQYSSQDGPYYVPNDLVVTPNSGGASINNVISEDQVKKRELRLQKNREAARECRRKKKEYIKCLENRVAVLENQNKALIDELKSLKELYCQHKPE